MPRRLLVPAVVLAVVVSAWAALTPEQTKALQDARYVYVQSERKSGEWGKPAEIWFFLDDGMVYVATRPTSWRVRRVQAGRTKARIAIGSPQGEAFEATAALVKNPAIEDRLMKAFATKYPDGWPRHEQSFRDGFKNGERVLVGYTPK